MEGAELVPLGSGRVHSVSHVLLLLLGWFFEIWRPWLFAFPIIASKWLRFITDLRLHLIVLIIFLRACAGGVARVEALMPFLLASNCILDLYVGFLAFFLFSKHEKNFL